MRYHWGAGIGHIYTHNGHRLEPRASENPHHDSDEDDIVDTAVKVSPDIGESSDDITHEEDDSDHEGDSDPESDASSHDNPHEEEEDEMFGVPDPNAVDGVSTYD